MSEDQFTKLFKYMEVRFANLESQLASKASVEQLDRVYNLLDTFLKKAETDDQERLAMGAQLKRHDDWIGRAAKQLKIKYQST